MRRAAMSQSSANVPRWRDPWTRDDHFRRHGPKLGLSTVDEYDRSALETMRLGKRFTYTDLTSGKLRVGYYDPGPNRFLALTADERFIVNHLAPDGGERYVRATLQDSTYR